ncbi:hypothetical protein Celaphus_00017699 [Cervus elaphus hippelaphus]|uniref:Rho-GAP domain-containing protein n=1 Tax=Cervus elaphus hippelaphus TaxID=46360 RepID=A0A212C6H5_CEREH|nr:hypothetical protein Celaphus_00017699 [Cervus elaphus hippelaphus]
MSILEAIPDVPVHSNGAADPGRSAQNVASEAEELSFEVSYSEKLTQAPKRNRFKKLDFKKEDYVLPKFVVQKTRFGLTKAEDLSAEDMKKIRHLSLIELTAFFDAFRIQLKRNKTEKVKGRVLLENDRRKDSGVKVPLVLQKQYREELDAKFNADKFKWEKMCHREAAVMLKAFFRELPTSLFPVEYIPAFITLMERGPHIRVQFQALHLMVMALPDANRDTAQALMTFFNKVIANESKNRMSIWNISTIMAPNLFFSRSKHSDCEELLLANTAAHIIRLMLKYQEMLWTVPSFLIAQVRRMNEATMLLKKPLPSVKKLLRRKTIERGMLSGCISVIQHVVLVSVLLSGGPHIRVQFQALHLMVMALPDANRDTAQALMTFFNKVIANESKNRMSIWNISTIMAPNLFFSRSKHSDCEELLLANTAAHIIRLMLKYQEMLWTVPSFLIAQVRRMNEATMLLKKPLPSVKKLLRRKTIERGSDVPEGVIRVHAPLLSKVSMAIQLNGQTKVRDILAKFQCENSHGSSECMKIQNQRLYEIGGNIGQHCLDPDAYILDVYHVNPQAEWVIKPQQNV